MRDDLDKGMISEESPISDVLRAIKVKHSYNELTDLGRLDGW